MGAEISNPSFANRRAEVADYRYPVTAGGEVLLSPERVEEFVTSEAVPFGAALAYVEGAVGTVRRVKRMVTGDANTAYAGIALEARGTGETIRAVTGGDAIAWVGASAAAFGSVLLKPSATAGQFTTATAASLAATNILGEVLGVIQTGTKGGTASEFVHVYVKQF